MSDNDDITRIEDLSEFEHEDEDLDLDQFNDDSSQSFDLNNDATDPNIELPDEFLVGENSQIDEQDSFDDQGTFTSSEDQDGESSFSQDDFSVDATFDDDDTFDAQDSNFETQDSSYETEENLSDQEEQIDLDEALDDLAQISEQPLVIETEQIQSISPQADDHKESDNMAPKVDYQQPESFKELREFANTINYTNSEHEGNPPFSIVISDIKYREDVDDILIHLSEFGITKDAASTQAFKESLLRGSCLISRLSEFAAITLCHKLRRFSLNLKMGLTEQVNPPKSYSSNDKGLASKYSVLNSQNFNYKFDKSQLQASEIIVSTLSSIEGTKAVQQMGIASVKSCIKTSTLKSSTSIDITNFDGAMEEFKQIAFTKKANAVIGIQFQVLGGSETESTNILITGNLVWLQDL